MEQCLPPLSNNINAKEYEIQDDIHTYWIKVKGKEDNLIISVNKEGTIPRRRYENSFPLKSLMKIHRWFRMFSLLPEVFTELCYIFEDKKYQIKEQDGILKVTFQIIIREQTEFTLEIPEIETNKDEMLNDCCHSINQLSNKVSSFLERITNLEEIIKQPCSQLLKEEDIKLFEKLLCDPTKEKIKYDLIYRASRCNGDGNIFHDLCDNKGPTITIIKTHNNHVFGGYTSKSWNASVSNYIADDKAFLFSRNLQKVFPIKAPTNAIYCAPSSGPNFGSGRDINITHNCCLNKTNVTNLASYSDGSAAYVLNGGQNGFYVVDYEVYLITILKID